LGTVACLVILVVQGFCLSTPCKYSKSTQGRYEDR
jgi:hypothetical protein